MRLGYYILCGLALMSCNSSTKPTENEKLAEKKGRLDAQEVIKSAPNSMAREKALLSIRATEEKIKQLGDTLAAKAYIKAAEICLDSAGVLTINRDVETNADEIIPLDEETED